MAGLLMTEATSEDRSVLAFLADVLRGRAAATVEEMRKHPVYWGPEVTDAAFIAGVENAVSDVPLATTLPPSVAYTLADLIEILAVADTDGTTDLCVHAASIFNTARDLAARFPGCNVGEGYTLAMRPRPPEPSEFGAKIWGWCYKPADLTAWVKTGEFWVNESGARTQYENITVTGIPGDG